MIDLLKLRENTEAVINALKKKDPSFDGQKLAELDKQQRALLVQVETLRAQKNQLAAQAKGGITPEIREQSKEIGTTLKSKTEELEQVSKDFKELYLRCPNIPADDTPVGGKEANKVVKTVGEQPVFDFEPKNHVDLGLALGWFDFEAAAKMTGSQFVFYKDEGVKLIYALMMFMMQNNMKHGFTPMLPPYLVNEKSLEVAGNFPKFKDEVYSVPEEGLYLIPTSEVSLTNLYRDTTFMSSELPKRMTSWTSCFRREAGGYGAQERGLIRIHQFEKAELYTVCEPSKANDELDRMLACAEDILQQLGLHYQVSLLASQDMSFQSAKTFDIEVWMPGQQKYYEVSSGSNCTDFQARRGGMRFKAHQNDKTQLVNTLNASSLALPRLMVALIETYQQADGTIKLPDALKGFGLL
ncbi:serine--tRNA ligase [bacterium]|jgi:seryl-tRNA synthetase|nr:serine--tRNA ligase [bacterium]MBT5014859.1 serine--tRNA ligase [bacterium]